MLLRLSDEAVIKWFWNQGEYCIHQNPLSNKDNLTPRITKIPQVVCEEEDCHSGPLWERHLDKKKSRTNDLNKIFPIPWNDLSKRSSHFVSVNRLFRLIGFQFRLTNFQANGAIVLFCCQGRLKMLARFLVMLPFRVKFFFYRPKLACVYCISTNSVFGHLQIVVPRKALCPCGSHGLKRCCNVQNKLP